MKENHVSIYSVFYRTILVLLSAILLLIVYDSPYLGNYWYYLAIGIVYVVGIIIFVLVNPLDVMRQLLDYSYITLFILGHQELEVFVFFFVLFPLINAIYHSGNKTRFWPVILWTSFVVLYISNWNWLYLSIVAILSVIDWLANKRYSRSYAINSVMEQIDEFLIAQESLSKTHTLYQVIMTQLNKLYARFLNIKSIQAYKLNEDRKMWLVNSSYVEYRRMKILTEEQIMKLEEFSKDKLGIVNLTGSETKWMFMFSLNKLRYVFVVNIDIMRLFKFPLDRINKDLYQLLGKMATLLKIEYQMREYKNKKFDELRDQYIYVSTAKSMIHFVRNQLTPINNLLEFYKLKEKYPEEVVKELESTELPKEFKSATNSIAEIKKVAEYMLGEEKALVDDKEGFNLHMFYIVLSEIVQKHLNAEVELGDGFENAVNDGKKWCIHCSRIQTKILLDDWIKNMSKFQKSYASTRIQVVDQSVQIVFCNNHNLSDEEVSLLIKDINSKDKDTVIERRRTYGIISMKKWASEQGVDMHADRTMKYSAPDGSIIDNCILLTLIFGMYESVSI